MSSLCRYTVNIVLLLELGEDLGELRPIEDLGEDFGDLGLKEDPEFVGPKKRPPCIMAASWLSIYILHLLFASSVLLPGRIKVCYFVFRTKTRIESRGAKVVAGASTRPHI